MQIVSYTIYMKYQNLISGKDEKRIILSSAEFSQRVVKELVKCVITQVERDYGVQVIRYNEHGIFNPVTILVMRELIHTASITSLFYLEYILHVHSIKRSLYRFLLTRLD